MEKEFSTRNLVLAATLVTLKVFYNRIDFTFEGEKNNPVGYFIFEETEELKDIETKFRRGELLVEPKEFMTNVHQLKSEVMNYLRSPHNILQ